MTLTFRIIWIYQLIHHWLSFPWSNIHPIWLSPTNDLKFDDYRYQINLVSIVNLPLLIIKFSFICEGQSYGGPYSNFTVSAQAIILYNEFENHDFKIVLPHLPGASELIAVII